MKRTLIKSVIALAASGFAAVAFSAPQWYATYGVGAVKPGINTHVLVNNNSGASPPYNNDTYTSQNSNAPALLVEIGEKYNMPGNMLEALLLGLQYQHIFATSIGKDIIQYSSPDFLNYHYDLNLEANILLLNGKFDLFTWKQITPFINLGAGVLQFIASDYNEYALSGVTARTSPDYQKNVIYRATYQAGAGFSWHLTNTLIASANYIYRPLSHFETKNGKGTWSDRNLNFGDVNANSVFVTLTTSLA